MICMKPLKSIRAHSEAHTKVYEFNTNYNNLTDYLKSYTRKNNTPYKIRYRGVRLTGERINEL